MRYQYNIHSFSDELEDLIKVGFSDSAPVMAGSPTMTPATKNKPVVTPTIDPAKKKKKKFDWKGLAPLGIGVGGMVAAGLIGRSAQKRGYRAYKEYKFDPSKFRFNFGGAAREAADIGGRGTGRYAPHAADRVWEETRKATQAAADKAASRGEAFQRSMPTHDEMAEAFHFYGLDPKVHKRADVVKKHKEFVRKYHPDRAGGSREELAKANTMWDRLHKISSLRLVYELGLI